MNDECQYELCWICWFQGEAMRIVYRMRGLLGDATEDMVNSLDSKGGAYITHVFSRRPGHPYITIIAWPALYYNTIIAWDIT